LCTDANHYEYVNADSVADSNKYYNRDAYVYCNSDRYGDPHGDAYEHSNADCDLHCHGNVVTDTHIVDHSYADTNRNLCAPVCRCA
jgi:hypothetical protein